MSDDMNAKPTLKEMAELATNLHISATRQMYDGREPKEIFVRLEPRQARVLEGIFGLLELCIEHRALDYLSKMAKKARLERERR